MLLLLLLPLAPGRLLNDGLQLDGLLRLDGKLPFPPPVLVLVLVVRGRRQQRLPELVAELRELLLARGPQQQGPASPSARPASGGRSARSPWP